MFRVGIEHAALHEHHFVHAVGAPEAVVIGLEPVDADNGIEIEGGVAVIRFDEGLVESQFFPPNEGIGKGVAPNFGIGFPEHPLEPVYVFAVVYVRDFRFVHVEGGNRYAARNGVPVMGYILVGNTHCKGTAFHENQVRTSCLAFVIDFFKSAPLLIVVHPAGCGRTFFGAAGRQQHHK